MKLFNMTAYRFFVLSIACATSHLILGSTLSAQPSPDNSTEAPEVSETDKNVPGPDGTAPAADAPTAEVAVPNPPQNFIRRFVKAYLDDWKGSPDGPAPKYRGFPAPVSNPPFPFTVWPYSGSVTIGQPWTQAGPLMTAIWAGSGGDAWKKSGFQIYGWLNAGANYVCANSINDSKYAYNNLAAYYATWYHKFSKTSSWHSATESWYQYETQVPNAYSGETERHSGRKLNTIPG